MKALSSEITETLSILAEISVIGLIKYKLKNKDNSRGFWNCIGALD